MKPMNTLAQKALLGLALSAVVFAACGTRNNSGRQTSTTTATNPEERPLAINQFQQVHATRYLMADITEALSRPAFSSTSSRETDKTRNLVFFDGESLALRKLFDTNAYVILHTTRFPSHNL